MWWFDSNKTKPNKTKNQAPSFLQIQVLILKACVPSTVALYEEMCGFFFFLICFLFFFFLLFFAHKKEKIETISEENPDSNAEENSSDSEKQSEISKENLEKEEEKATS